MERQMNKQLEIQGDGEINRQRRYREMERQIDRELKIQKDGETETESWRDRDRKMEVDR